MRSAAAPRIRHDAAVTVEADDGAREGRAVNLSVGGVFVATGSVLDPGAQVGVKMDLGDGGRAVGGKAEVVWNCAEGMALRFVGMDDASAGRIARVVSARLRESGRAGQPARIKLPSLPSPLRAVAHESTPDALVLEAELPWLRLGAEVVTELGSGRSHAGTIRWVGVDVTNSGAARLRILVHGDAARANADAPIANDAPIASAASVASAASITNAAPVANAETIAPVEPVAPGEKNPATATTTWRASTPATAALARAVSGSMPIVVEAGRSASEPAPPRRAEWAIALAALVLASAGAFQIGLRSRAPVPSLLTSSEPAAADAARLPARYAIPRAAPELAPAHHHHHSRR